MAVRSKTRAKMSADGWSVRNDERHGGHSETARVTREETRKVSRQDVPGSRAGGSFFVAEERDRRANWDETRAGSLTRSEDDTMDHQERGRSTCKFTARGKVARDSRRPRSGE